MIAKHVVVTGRVQGVWFRAWTREQAQALGVSGWVRNQPDGSVEAVLTGTDTAVEAVRVTEAAHHRKPGSTSLADRR